MAPLEHRRLGVVSRFPADSRRSVYDRIPLNFCVASNFGGRPVSADIPRWKSREVVEIPTSADRAMRRLFVDFLGHGVTSNSCPARDSRSSRATPRATTRIGRSTTLTRPLISRRD